MISYQRMWHTLEDTTRYLREQGVTAMHPVLFKMFMDGIYDLEDKDDQLENAGAVLMEASKKAGTK